MTDGGSSPPDARRVERASPAKIVLALLRAAGSTIVLVAIYYLLPLDTSATWLAITILVIGLAAFVGLVGFHARAIIAAPFPTLRALEAFAIIVPIFLLLFAGTYAVLGHASAGNFSQHMTHTNALYFTVTVFSTVGFGDITATAPTPRLVVTAQMVLDLIVLGIGIKVLLGAVTRGRQRQSDDTGTVQPGN
jgi:hypothetical protein